MQRCASPKLADGVSFVVSGRYWSREEKVTIPDIAVIIPTPTSQYEDAHLSLVSPY